MVAGAARPGSGKRSAAAVRTRLGVGGAVEQREEVEDLLGLEAGAFDVELVDGGLDVGQAAEIDADGGAARGRLRARREAAGIDGFAGLGEVGDRGGRGR